MEQWVTIITVTYPHEVAIIRSKLESEEIETYEHGELSSQVYASSYGGIKIDVRESDAERANEILREGGFI